MESHKTNKSSVSCPCYRERERELKREREGGEEKHGVTASTKISLPSLCYTTVGGPSGLYGWTNIRRWTPLTTFPHSWHSSPLSSHGPTENNHSSAMNENIQWTILLFSNCICRSLFQRGFVPPPAHLTSIWFQTDITAIRLRQSCFVFERLMVTMTSEPKRKGRESGRPRFRVT